jgi:hypothetical protein
VASAAQDLPTSTAPPRRSTSKDRRHGKRRLASLIDAKRSEIERLVEERRVVLGEDSAAFDKLDRREPSYRATYIAGDIEVAEVQLRKLLSERDIDPGPHVATGPIVIRSKLFLAPVQTQAADRKRNKKGARGGKSSDAGKVSDDAARNQV